MVQPSPVLCARIRFSTKQVGFGFYRGNRTGSVGAHTQYGGYLVDWRKVRNYAAPDLAGFKLTPYVTREIDIKAEAKEDEGQINEIHQHDPLARQSMRFLRSWRSSNYEEFEEYVRSQYEAKHSRAEEADEEILIPTRNEVLQDNVQTSEEVKGGAWPVTVQAVNPWKEGTQRWEQWRAKQERLAEKRRAEEEAQYAAEVAAAEAMRVEEEERAEAKRAAARAAEEARRLKEATTNGPRRYRMNQADLHARSKAKELRKLVKETAERRAEAEKRMIARQTAKGAVRLTIFEEAYKKKAQELAAKLAS